jgi:hypothetical protein
MTVLGITRNLTDSTRRDGLFGLGETMLRILLVTALPVSAVIFAIQTF